MDMSEHAVDCEKEDGQDMEEQRRAAAQTISEPGNGDRRVSEAPGSPVNALRGK